MGDRIIEIIRGCLVEVTEKPVDRLTTDMRLDEDFDLDSVMFVQFLLALEDRIPNLRFDPEEIGEASFNDVGKLASFLSQAAA